MRGVKDNPQHKDMELLFATNGEEIWRQQTYFGGVKANGLISVLSFILTGGVRQPVQRIHTSACCSNPVEILTMIGWKFGS